MQNHNLLPVAFIVLLVPASAFAEQGEFSVGVRGGLFFPGFEPQSPTAFDLATWSVGGTFSYGLLDSLSLVASFDFATFSASAKDQVFLSHNREIVGNLRFDSAYYHPEIGIRYKLYSGYSLAPYLEAHLGYLLAAYSDKSLTTDSGTNIGLELEDSAEGSLTFSVGLSADYRLFETFLLGLSFLYTKSLEDELYDHDIQIPLSFSYYWF